VLIRTSPFRPFRPWTLIRIRFSRLSSWSSPNLTHAQLKRTHRNFQKRRCRIGVSPTDGKRSLQLGSRDVARLPNPSRARDKRVERGAGDPKYLSGSGELERVCAQYFDERTVIDRAWSRLPHFACRSCIKGRFASIDNATLGT
jgi:hypothetical protein